MNWLRLPKKYFEKIKLFKQDHFHDCKHIYNDNNSTHDSGLKIGIYFLFYSMKQSKKLRSRCKAFKVKCHKIRGNSITIS